MPFRIDASDGTSESGGGNQGVLFFGALSANPGSALAGVNIDIDNTGSGFFSTMIVRWGGAGGTSGDNIVVAAQNKITVDVPAVAPGSYDIYVENPDGENQTIAGFVVLAPTTTTTTTTTTTPAPTDRAKRRNSLRLNTVSGFGFRF